MKHNIVIYCKILLILLACSSVHALGQDYSPMLEVSGGSIRNRTITELNLLTPLVSNNNDLISGDIKLKNDNKKSWEYNLGLVYRHNFNDHFISGIYGYFDHRKTSNKMHVKQLTLGAEILSEYIDARVNLYLPENKRKLSCKPSRELVFDAPRVFMLEKGGKYEHAMPGYDFEIGVPIFAPSTVMHKKLGSKFYVAKYLFKKDGIAKYAGTRFRIEQKLAENIFNINDSYIKLDFGGYYNNHRKWDGFAGISVRWPLFSTNRKKRTKMQKRMMDTVIRDVDIVTAETTLINQVPLEWNNNEVKNIYYIAVNNDKDYSGDGSFETPFSQNQLQKDKDLQRKSGSLFVPVEIGNRSMTSLEYQRLISMPGVVNLQNQSLILSTKDKKHHFDILPYFMDGSYASEVYIPPHNQAETINEQLSSSQFSSSFYSDSSRDVVYSNSSKESNYFSEQISAVRRGFVDYIILPRSPYKKVNTSHISPYKAPYNRSIVVSRKSLILPASQRKGAKLSAVIDNPMAMRSFFSKGHLTNNKTYKLVSSPELRKTGGVLSKAILNPIANRKNPFIDPGLKANYFPNRFRRFEPTRVERNQSVEELVKEKPSVRRKLF